MPKLTPTAEFESNYIASHIPGNKNPISYPAVPHLVFTFPRIAAVGVTIEEAQSNKEEYRIVSVPYSQAMLWLSKNEKDIELTFIFNKENLLVGAAIYGSDAENWIDILTLIINKKLTTADLREMIFSFPTQTYGLTATLISAFLRRD